MTVFDINVPKLAHVGLSARDGNKQAELDTERWAR